MSGSVFVTPHRGLASFLMYCLGDDVLLNCFVDHPQGGRGKIKIFYSLRDDDGGCQNLERDFFNGAGVSDARALLECGKEISHRTTDTFRKHREEIEREGK